MQARRDFHGMHQRHAEDADVEVERHLHVVGIEGEVMDAAGNRSCAHRRMLAVIVAVVQVRIMRVAVRHPAMGMRVRMRFVSLPRESMAT